MGFVSLGNLNVGTPDARVADEARVECGILVGLTIVVPLWHVHGCCSMSGDWAFVDMESLGLCQEFEDIAIQFDTRRNLPNIAR